MGVTGKLLFYMLLVSYDHDDETVTFVISVILQAVINVLSCLMLL